MKTYVPDNNSTEQNWVVVDASDVPLGRLATLIASRIRGKHRPDFTPNIMNGDFVVVVNAEKVALTGKKMDQKVYTRYSGYQGGLKKETARTAIAKHPERVIEHAVFGMLPKGRQGRAMHPRLKVYAGEQHPHAAQQPTKLENK
ncbi:50S ribosomal protein L13 [Deinococcus rubellus]|uniref:Large ribosomal subunit protein uL13 n=1 Tax=Deinococcus rubellus TaxID=1889240 RepID=A0ABY5YHR1_9DEIO|nr:50S ribosomal protein L13 [Deinococcus rubellus]UWX63819.1 50S ribosomal protein L13 [Deinococcus rubellus]